MSNTEYAWYDIPVKVSKQLKGANESVSNVIGIEQHVESGND